MEIMERCKKFEGENGDTWSVWDRNVKMESVLLGSREILKRAWNLIFSDSFFSSDVFVFSHKCSQVWSDRKLKTVVKWI